MLVRNRGNPSSDGRTLDGQYKENSVKDRRLGFFAAACVLVMGVPALAHHGTSVTYDVTKTITLNGTVTEFSYSYPHPQLYFDVKDANGTVQHWGSEFAPTPLMMKNMNVGWSKDSIKPGDTVMI